MTIVSAAIVAVRSTIEWIGFWTAVALPLGYFYLFYNGLTGPELVTLVQLVGVHGLAFVVGQGYNAGAPDDRPVPAYRDRNRTL